MGNEREEQGGTIAIDLGAAVAEAAAAKQLDIRTMEVTVEEKPKRTKWDEMKAKILKQVEERLDQIPDAEQMSRAMVLDRVRTSARLLPSYHASTTFLELSVDLGGVQWRGGACAEEGKLTAPAPPPEGQTRILPGGMVEFVHGGIGAAVCHPARGGGFSGDMENPSGDPPSAREDIMSLHRRLQREGKL
jgi:hypothetical protein